MVDLLPFPYRYNVYYASRVLFVSVDLLLVNFVLYLEL